ncbi:hypothetical protein RTBOTA2_005677 [Rhodotorula toruloides]|uniref:F-box domain-containing protein n=1 Tax=Rhodotorula toruloides TaxID=5286 RepID=A0A0K3CM81_RHOTO|nr:hypothetical protein RTBOTA2_005677 [Rhodotorula toruloides]PRQ72275.1 hypothetical protein AAT19DRAFT_9614 [Rhodotorula toruloides]
MDLSNDLARLELVDPSSRHSLASRLPVDACQHICDAVRRLPPAVATSTLYALSLVSKTWSTAAQSALHHTPFLTFDAPDTVPPRTFARLETLLRTLGTRDNLARSVRELDIGRWTARCSSEAKVDRRRISAIAVKIVAACPALKVLSLPFVVQADKKDLVVALKRLSQLERFTVDEDTATADPWIINIDVSIKEEWGKAIWTIADLAALAPSWPRIKVLELYSAVHSGQGDVVVDWQLDEFTLYLNQNVKLGFTYLNRLLHGSRGSLRRLNIQEHRLEPGALARFLEEYGGTLDTLTTFTADYFTVDETLPVAIATHCPNLSILFLDTPIPDLADALSQLSRLRHLRSVLLHTVFATRLDRDQVLETLRSFRSLKSLGISPGAHDVPNLNPGLLYLPAQYFFDTFCAAIDDIRDAVREDGINVRELRSWDGRPGFKPIRGE